MSVEMLAGLAVIVFAVLTLLLIIKVLRKVPAKFILFGMLICAGVVIYCVFAP